MELHLTCYYLRQAKCCHSYSLTILAIDHNPQASEHVPPAPLRQNPLCSPRIRGLYPSHQHLLLYHSIQVRAWGQPVREGTTSVLYHISGEWRRLRCARERACCFVRSPVPRLDEMCPGWSWMRAAVCDAFLRPEGSTCVLPGSQHPWCCPGGGQQPVCCHT